jgi:hypothetical protein
MIERDFSQGILYSVRDHRVANRGRLDYQAEEALTLLGQVVAEQQRFDRFEELAMHMGTRQWKRIIVLADRAVKQRKRQLAVAVSQRVSEIRLISAWKITAFFSSLR